MKKKVLAFLCMLTILASLFAAAAPSVASAAYTVNGATGEFKAGFAKICINPRNDNPVPLGGYSDGTERLYAIVNGKLSTEEADKLTKAAYTDDNGNPNDSSGVGGEFYYSSGTPNVAPTSADGLFATAIAVQDRNGQIAIFISYDGISTSANVVSDTKENDKNGVRTRVVNAAKELGLSISADSINVNASHSHSGVYMSGGNLVDGVYAEDGLDYDGADYREDLRIWLTEAAIAALKDLKPATLSYGEANTVEDSDGDGNVEYMNFVRHYHDSDDDKSNLDVYGDNAALWQNGQLVEHVKDCDHNIYLLKFDRGTAAAPILLANWRAHPKANSTGTTTWGLAHRNCTSSDYVNSFRYTLEQQNYCVAFFQGAAGNVNSFSDLYGGLNGETISASNPTNRETLDEAYNNGSVTRVVQTANKYGVKLAEFAMAGLANMTAIEDTGTVRVSSVSLTEPRHMGKKDIYDVVSAVTVGDLWDSLQSDTNENGEKYLTLANSDKQELYGWAYILGGTTLTETWKQIMDMDVLTFLADYFNWSGAYDSAAEAVDNSNSTVQKVAKALMQKYYINSKYHVSTIYSNRNLSETTTGSFTVNAVSIGEELGFFFAPFELFDSNYQQPVLDDLGITSSYARPFVSGYSNNGSGYMPDWDAYTYAGTGSYEVNQTSYAQGTAEKIAQTMVSMLNDMQPDPPANTWCEYCEENVDWYPWNPLGQSAIYVPQGHYYLTKDYVSSDNFQKQISSTTCLNLNGHTYANQSTTTGKAFVINGGGTLNIMGNGVIQGQGVTEDRNKNGGVIQIASGGILNLYNGTIERVQAENQLANYGGAVCVETGGTFNMHSGTVTGGSAVKSAVSGLGGNVYVAGTFNMEGGTVSGGTAETYGNNVYVLGGGSFSMSGGEIVGGGVHLKGSLAMSGSSKITGGTVSGNGGNVYVDGGSFTMSGNSQISGGTANAGNGGNVYVDGASATVQMQGGTISDGLATMNSGGTAGQGGNVYINYGSFNMSAGQIIGGEAKRANQGGSVYSLYGPVTLSGGSITGGKAASGSGAGLFINKANAATLTLSGSATVTGNYNAAGTETNIYCDPIDLTVTGNYTGTAGVKVSSVTDGYRLGAAETGAKISGNLYADGNSDYIATVSGTDVVLTNKMVYRDEEGNTYGTFNEVLEASADTLTLLKDVEENITISKPVSIDLSGKVITGEVNYAEGATLTITDTRTDDFTVADGDYGKVPYSENLQVPEGYILIKETNPQTGVEEASAHRLDLSMKTVNVRTESSGMYYQSRFGGDELVKEQITEYGVAMSIGSAPTVESINADTEYKTHAGYLGDTWVVGNGDNSAYSVILEGILKPENGYTINKRNANTKVYGVAYAIVNGEMILGEEYYFSLRDLTEMINDQWDTLKLSEAQIAKLVNMYEEYQTVMRTWDIPRIQTAWQEGNYKGRTAVFVGDSITFGATLESDELQYWRHLQNNLGLGQVVNHGVSGSCISSNNDRGHNYSPLVDRYQNIPGADLIFIFMGTNDFGHATPLGTTADTTDVSVCGALNMVIDHLQQAHPDSKIVLITPIVRYTLQGGNTAGLMLKDYVDTIKTVGAYQNVPVLDIYEKTQSQLPVEYFSDKIHPTAEGHKILADIIKTELETNYSQIMG